MYNTDGGGCCCHARLHSLAKLSVQSNRLTSMRGLEACTALQELYLSHNGIETLEARSQSNIHLLWENIDPKEISCFMIYDP